MILKLPLFACLIVIVSFVSARAQTGSASWKRYTVAGQAISLALPTDAAGREQATGRVALKAVFTSAGNVSNTRIISELPFGLTARAVEAAKKIKFVPAVKDGHYVSRWMQPSTTSISTDHECRTCSK